MYAPDLRPCATSKQTDNTWVASAPARIRISWLLSYVLIPFLSLVAVVGWLRRFSILMKRRQRESQKREGGGRCWTRRVLQSARRRSCSSWELHSVSIQWIVIPQEWRFVVSGCILACVMDALTRHSRPRHHLVPLDSSSNGMFFSLLSERDDIWICKYTPYIQIQS